MSICVCENKLAVVWQPQAKLGDGGIGDVLGQQQAPKAHSHPQVLRT